MSAGITTPETVNGILDAMPVCSVGYVFKGSPYVTPTLQWREGDHMYWHGSSASRMLETVDGADVCVTVTIVDGFVLARSAFHHSANYRSVMAKGFAHKVTDKAEKEARLRTFVDIMYPGRWDILRADDRARSSRRRRFLACPSPKPRPRSAPGRPRTTKRIMRCRSGPACCRCGWRRLRRSTMSGILRALKHLHTCATIAWADGGPPMLTSE